MDDKYEKLLGEHYALKERHRELESKYSNLEKDSKKAFEKRDEALKNLKEMESTYKPQIEAFQKAETERIEKKYGDKLDQYNSYKEKGYDVEDIDRLLGVEVGSLSNTQQPNPFNKGSVNVNSGNDFSESIRQETLDNMKNFGNN